MQSRKKRAARIPCAAEVAIFVGSRKLVAQAVNVSTSGLLIELPEQVDPAGYVRLNFPLPDRGIWIDTDAVIVRVAQERGLCLWGVQFIQMPQAAAQELKRWIHSQYRARVASESQPGVEISTNVHASASAPPSGLADGNHDSIELRLSKADVRALYHQALDDMKGP